MTEYHCTKFQVQSSTLTEFRKGVGEGGGGLYNVPTPGATEDEKSPRQLGLSKFDAIRK